MPKMPVDVKKVMDAIANVGEERGLPVAVNLVFDPTASDTLIDEVLDAFVGVRSAATVRQVVLGEKVPDIPVPADLSVIVGGDSLLLGDVASAARAKGISTVVAIARGETFFSSDKQAAQAYADATLARNAQPTASGTAVIPGVGTGVPVADLIDIDISDGAKRPLEELGSWIVANAPAKRISMASCFPFLRHPLSVELTQHNAVANAAIGVVFFVPGADMPLITLNQIKLVLQLAAIHGRPLDKSRAKEVAAVLASGFGLRALARRLVGQVPVLGWAVKPAVAAAGTLAIGYAAAEAFDESGALAGVASVAGGVKGKVGAAASRTQAQDSTGS